jgi:hypothetical protein
MEVKLREFLIWALDKSEWSVPRSGIFTAGEGIPFTIKYEARWTPEVVTMFSRRKSNLPPPGIETRLLGRSARCGSSLSYVVQ